MSEEEKVVLVITGAGDKGEFYHKPVYKDNMQRCVEWKRLFTVCGLDIATRDLALHPRWWVEAHSDDWSACPHCFPELLDWPGGVRLRRDESVSVRIEDWRIVIRREGPSADQAVELRLWGFEAVELMEVVNLAVARVFGLGGVEDENNSDSSPERRHG